LIELKQIVKRYTMGSEVIHALDRVDLTIADHEFVAIIGPSGSGKSTLMNIVGCLDYPDEGEYLLDGEDVSEFSPRELAIIRNKKIGFIFQQFNLLGKLTAYENVELPLIYQGLPAAERKKRVTEALERVGLSDRMKHRPNQLSGGQQQRVAIARALSTKPSLILADEPTGNLDSKSGQDIIRMLHELHQQGNTIMLITHDNAISLEAERRLAIRDGRISVVNGNHDVTKLLHESSEGPAKSPEREESVS
jgi:putative ABC transport system ATP-binding protein